MVCHHVWAEHSYFASKDSVPGDMMPWWMLIFYQIFIQLFCHWTLIWAFWLNVPCNKVQFHFTILSKLHIEITVSYTRLPFTYLILSFQFHTEAKSTDWSCSCRLNMSKHTRIFKVLISDVYCQFLFVFCFVI